MNGNLGRRNTLTQKKSKAVLVNRHAPFCSPAPKFFRVVAKLSLNPGNAPGSSSVMPRFYLGRGKFYAPTHSFATSERLEPLSSAESTIISCPLACKITGVSNSSFPRVARDAEAQTRQSEARAVSVAPRVSRGRSEPVSSCGGATWIQIEYEYRQEAIT